METKTHIAVMPHKNGTITLRMPKGDYRLLRLLIQRLAESGNTADDTDHAQDILHNLPARV